MRKSIHTDYYEKAMIISMIIDSVLIDASKTETEKQIAVNKAKEKLIEYKREYRKKLKDSYYSHYLYHGDNGEGYGEIVASGGDWDDYWYKVFFTNENWTEEDKKEFVDENWVYCTPSQYDCTGQRFTWAINCFNVPKGVVCYIREALDV